MQLTDKRFMIFEVATIVYAIGLMLIAKCVWEKTPTIGILTFLIGFSLISGLITWIIANGKHWFVFGLTYEAIFLLLITLCMIFDAIIGGYSVFNDLYLDILILFAFVFTIAVVCFIPSMILAFVGYHLFGKSGKGNNNRSGA
ncbi:MAG: hypothetical protein K2M11_07460 [Paramuribaculum sp.]|nr:hypothetical protein [Paramuribaculum sp.]